MTEFNEITQAMLNKYEDEYFKKKRVPSVEGYSLILQASVMAAIDAGWIDEPFDGFINEKWLEGEPDPVIHGQLEDIVIAVDKKYNGYIHIDPNG